jgi:hypothetical protein
MRSKSLIILSTSIFLGLFHLELEAKESNSVGSSRATAATELKADPKDENRLTDHANGLSKGTHTWQTYASVAAGDYGKGEMYALHVGYGYFLWDYLSVNVDLLGAYIRSGIDDNGVAAGLDVILRRHFSWVDDDRWSLYVDGGGGLQQQSTEFSGYRHFNFRLMAGIGGMLHLTDRVSMMGGARYLHISDGGIKGGGGGYDGPMFYIGAMLPF